MKIELKPYVDFVENLKKKEGKVNDREENEDIAAMEVVLSWLLSQEGGGEGGCIRVTKAVLCAASASLPF